MVDKYQSLGYCGVLIRIQRNLGGRFFWHKTLLISINPSIKNKERLLEHREKLRIQYYYIVFTIPFIYPINWSSRRACPIYSINCQADGSHSRLLDFLLSRWASFPFTRFFVE